MHNSKMRHRAEMLSCKLTHLTHLPRITRHKLHKFTCFHANQADKITCNYFCINLSLLGVLCRGTALDGTLHATCIQACKLYLHVNVIRLQKIFYMLTHVFMCALVYSI